MGEKKKTLKKVKKHLGLVILTSVDQTFGCLSYLTLFKKWSLTANLLMTQPTLVEIAAFILAGDSVLSMMSS